jgi:hypothetical protein
MKRKIFIFYSYRHKFVTNTLSKRFVDHCTHTYIHTNHALEGVKETSQIFLRDTNYLPILLYYQFNVFTFIHTYYSRFIPKGVAETSQMGIPQRHPRFTKMT